MNEPEQTKQGQQARVQLGDIFSVEQLAHIEKVCSESKDVSDAATKLRPYFREMSDQLDAKGLLVDYAAYAIPFHIMRAQGRVA